MMMSSLSSTNTRAVQFRDMGMYEPFQQLSGWENTFNTITSTNNNNQTSSTVHEVDAARPEADVNNKGNYTSLYNNSVEAEPSSNNDQGEVQINDKTKRRLAQNREAACKSRLRKKAHVQQLEESRLKLSQLEQELIRARQQGLCVTSDASYLAAFEMEYKHWLDEQSKRVSEIRTAVGAHISDVKLKMLVDVCLNHYANLFRMKADAAKADVFFLISGMWRTSTERFFQWIGGFRPSELLNVVMTYIEPLTDQQLLAVRNLQQSSQQAEEALSQGLDKLQPGLVENIAAVESLIMEELRWLQPWIIFSRWRVL
ncbi:Basic-leucine zipper domain-containing protein [Hirschfeldia incana]|nr:Basic-leucine zipper domain-containing protein [Hirschfeldia incana]